MKPSRQTVGRHLAKLGDSPQRIARSLMKRGIKGIPRDGRACVLAVFLRREFADYDLYWISVMPTCCYFFAKSGPYSRVSLSDPLATFQDRFDDGLYPELVAEKPTSPVF